MKQLHSDRGGEYLSDDFTHHLKSKSTEWKLITHNTPEHNGVAERLNRTLVERVRTILHDSGLLKNLWREALLHIVWVKNRSATRALDGKTPYEMLYGKKPNLGDLPRWGAKCWVLDRSGSKLDDRARKGHWVGFDAKSTAHRIYLPDRHIVVVECNVTFQKVNKLTSIRLESESDQPTLPTIPTKQDVIPVSTPPAPSPSTADATDLSNGPELWRSNHLRKDSPYIKLLKAGVGTHDGREGGTLLPKGIHEAVVKGVEGERALSVWELDEEHAVFALLAGTREAEGLELVTVDEART